MKFIATNASYRESVTVYRVPERPPVKLIDLDPQFLLYKELLRGQWTNAQENASCDATAI